MMKKIENAKLYQEKQRFFPKWVLFVFFIAVSFVIVGWFEQIFYNEKFGDSPMNNLSLTVFVFLLCILLYGGILMSLEIILFSSKIVFRFKPFVNSSIDLGLIKSLRIVKYKFWGFGIRISLKYGMVYNVRGNYGLQIIMKDGQKFLLGIANPQEIKNIFKQKSIYMDKFIKEIDTI